MRYFLDTNALISIVTGNANTIIPELEEADWLGTSVICQLECYAFPDITESEMNLFDDYLKQIDVVSLEIRDRDLIRSIIQVRKTTKLKLPDAIVYATAKSSDAMCVTNDKDILKQPNTMPCT